jgi:hypothetical protein
MNIYEHAMLSAINAARTSRGVHALRHDDRLASAAYGHAVDLSRTPGLLHTGSDGSTILERILRAGYNASWHYECVGWGWDGRIEPMVQWWLDSPAHAAIVLDANVTDIGVGYVVAPGSVWGHYWVVDFAAGDSRVAPPPPAPPRPYTSHAPIVVGGTVAAGLALLDYLRGDDRAYRVGNGWGTFEVFQTQTEGDRFYQVKAWDDLSVVNWEEFVVNGEFIGRDVDTSPGGGRFYRQFAAPWVKRRMRIGESFTAAKRVQFYRADDCAPLTLHSGSVTDTITLVEHLAEWRSRFGVELRDVIRLRWEQGGEDYYYARGLGMVAWRRAHNDQHSPEWSAISEMRPDVGRLRRLAIPCL